MKKIFWIIAIALILTIGASVTAIAISEMPENVALRSVSNAIGDFAKREEFDSMTSSLYGSSISASFSTFSHEGEDLLENCSFNGKIYISRNALMLADVSLVDGDKRLAGELYLSNKKVYVKEDHILGGTYGANLSKLESQLKSSIFAPNENSSIALSEKDYNRIVKLLNDDGSFTKDAEKLADNVTADLWRLICDYAEFNSETDSNGNRVVTVTLTPKKLSSLLRSTVEYFRSSDKIRDFIDEHEDDIRDLLSTYGIKEDEDLIEKYNSFVDKLEIEVNRIRVSLGSDAENLTAIITTPKMSAKLLKLEIKNGSEAVVTLDCGNGGVKNSESISLVVGDHRFFYKGVVGGGEIDVSFFIGIDSSNSLTFSVKASEKDNLCAVTYQATSGTGSKHKSASLSLEGSLTKTKDTTTVIFDKLVTTAYGSTNQVINMDMTLVIDKNDRMPRPISKFTTIDKITYEEVFEWKRELKSFGK